MDAPATSKKTLGTTDPFLRIVPSSGTVRVSTNPTLKANSLAGPSEAYVTVAETIIRDAHMAYLHNSVLTEVGEDYSDEEEQEWDALFAQPQIQAGLDRLEEKAMRQFRAGKIIEGGFAVE